MLDTRTRFFRWKSVMTPCRAASLATPAVAVLTFVLGMSRRLLNLAERGGSTL